MSVLFLRVDGADSKSTPAQISKFLRCKKSFITTFICIGRLGLKIPRDIRRMIAIEWTDPIPSKLNCSITEYYKFYVTHPTTQKYNPYILTFGALGCDSAIGTLVFLDNYKCDYCNFRHPFEKMLREPSIMILQTYGISAPASIVRDGKYIYDFTAPHYGDVIMGIICDQFVSGFLCVDLYNVSLIDRFELYNNNVRAFNIDCDLLRLYGDPKRLDELYVQIPPKIYRVRHGIWAPTRMYHTSIRLITKAPPSQIALVYGFFNPEYYDKLSFESTAEIARIAGSDGNVY